MHSYGHPGSFNPAVITNKEEMKERIAEMNVDWLRFLVLVLYALIYICDQFYFAIHVTFIS